MTRDGRPRVLLIWPGGSFAEYRSFGVPQLLSVAAAVRNVVDAKVDVVDLDFERAFGAVDLARLVRDPYDLVGISCYSSFEYRKVMALAERLRQVLPSAWIVTGGHHATACPDDFLRQGSPFDYVITGDGEEPMTNLALAFASGVRPDSRVQTGSGKPLPPAAWRPDWHLLDRYRPVARKLASQAAIHLSRGCPSGCALCMDRSKRRSTWQAIDPVEAVDELHRFDAWLDLSSWTLFASDASFGVDRTWRRTFLDALARRPIRARTFRVLARIDTIDREDITLMAAANVAPWFGLASGDPALLSVMGRSPCSAAFLDHMTNVARWATARGVPFGVNVIVGHPGETEASLRTTADYVQRLFTEGEPCTGFVSVDPFRIYPGSVIAENLDQWIQSTGMRIHRYPWWYDGDQDFLSQWVDPSSELNFRGLLRLRREAFGPIVEAVSRRFAYHGKAHDDFERAMREQVARLSPQRHLRVVGLWHLWSVRVGERSGDDAHAAVLDDAELADVARDARTATLRAGGVQAADPLLRAIVEVPRERYVRIEDIARSADDRALALLDGGHATVSAIRSYVRTFEALALQQGDCLVDLGGGTGYGAAIAARIVGPSGRVTTIEIDPELSSRAARNLAACPHVHPVCADAHDTSVWRGATKVSVGFAVERIPQAWVDALAPGGVIVAPVGPLGGQRLTRITRLDGEVRIEDLGDVRYVPDRSPRASPRAGA